MRDFNALQFLASHMMRHNPKHAPPKKTFKAKPGHTIDHKKLVEVIDSFELAASDDGTITSDDLRGVLRGRGHMLSSSGIKRLLCPLMNLDRVQSGIITFDEYIYILDEVIRERESSEKRPSGDGSDRILIKAVFDLTTAQLQYLTKQFIAYDTNGDGTITKSEIKMIFKSQAIQLSESDVDKLFISIDTDNNGRIDFHEFVKSHVRSVGNEAAVQESEADRRLRASVANQLKSIKASFDR
jgi:Ca2+-binding EF-hand superfamily protein